MTRVVNGRIFSDQRRAIITGTGCAVPEKILTNDDLSHIVETSDEWITTRTGIKHRHIIGEGETTASLGTAAARKALQAAGLDADGLDMIVCATVTPEMVFPATACFIQEALGNNHCCAFDLTAACSGFTYGVGIAAAFISSGQCDNIMVIGAETLSNITNYQDRSSCILFGDGAGAALLQAEENSQRGVIYSSLHSDGSGWNTLGCQAYGSRYPANKPLADKNKIYMEINGRETYQLAVRRIVELIEDIYEKCHISNDDIALVIPHQMNARIIDSVVKRLKLPEEKMFVNIEKYGNTSAASIPIALDEAVRQGRIKKGQLAILVAFGGGLTWAANLVKL